MNNHREVTFPTWESPWRVKVLIIGCLGLCLVLCVCVCVYVWECVCLLFLGQYSFIDNVIRERVSKWSKGKLLRERKKERERERERERKGGIYREIERADCIIWSSLAPYIPDIKVYRSVKPVDGRSFLSIPRLEPKLMLTFSTFLGHSLSFRHLQFAELLRRRKRMGRRIKMGKRRRSWR